MEEILKQVLGEREEGMLARLKDEAGFSSEEATGFLGPALEQVMGALKGGKLELSSLLGGSLDDVLAGIDLGALTSKLDLDVGRITSGLKALIPDLGAALSELPSGAAGLEQLLGGSGGGLKGIVGKLLG